MNEFLDFSQLGMGAIDVMRHHHGIPKSQLCARANVNKTTYLRYLAGHHSRMSELTTNRIRRALEAMIAERDARKVLG
jgi:hypothetical protein